MDEVMLLKGDYWCSGLIARRSMGFDMGFRA
jgi:hypothetical protein